MGTRGSPGRQFLGKGGTYFGSLRMIGCQRAVKRKQGIWGMETCLLFEKVSIRPMTKPWRNVRARSQRRGSGKVGGIPEAREEAVFRRRASALFNDATRS